MKRNLDIRLYFLPLLFAMVALLPACKKNDAGGAAPVVTSVRMYLASPKDTIMSTGNPKTDPSWTGGTGQYVVITGHNLQTATEIDFDGVPAPFNAAFITSDNAVVKVPPIMYSTVDTSKLYTLQFKTKAGSTTFSFKLGPAAPKITAISDVFANPGDSVYLYGSNLVLIQHFSYGGTPVSSFKYSLDGTSLGFLMPATTTTQQITLIAKGGSLNFPIVATPTITLISKENPIPGDSVYIYGTYLKNIQSLTFAGTAISSFTTSSNGKWIGFVAPTLSQSGPVSVTTPFGTGTTVYNVNDIATGAMSNWEWNGDFNWQWWGGASVTSGDPNSGWPPYSPDFPGNTSLYMVLKTGVLSPAEGNTYSSYAILMNASQWVPSANLSDSPDSWAFKFDVSVPQNWNGGSIDIISGFGNYIYRWEPWQVTPAKTKPYTTKGWITVTVPLSAFRTTDPTLGAGEGDPISQITDLTGPTGNSSCTMYIHNYGASATATGFYGAFDNLRIVKIK